MRIVSLLLLVLSVLVAAPCGAAQAAPAADRDGDKIFDDLETQLGGSGAHPVIVALQASASAGRVDDIEADVGGLGPVRRLRLVDAFTAVATPDQIRALAAREDVAHVEEDARVVPFGVTAQASFGVTRAREELPGLDGAGLVAAVVDSGVDTGMADLPPSKVVAFADLVNGRAAPYDDLGHGSLVSDILAGSGASGAEGRGVAPAAKLVSVKVIDDKAQSSLGKIAEGIQWAVEHRAQYGIDLINLSIGDPTGCGAGTDIASQAVDAAVAAGLLVIAAAGNSGPDPCTVKSPGAAESALTVGAMSDLGAGGFTNGWFSSRGPTLDGRLKPDLSAPGVNVVVATPSGKHEPQIGSSAAAPFVAGAALLMLQAEPALTPAQIKAAMTATAIDFGPVGRDTEYGAGRLDVYAALRAIGAPLATPPAVPEHELWTGTLAEGEVATRTVDIADPRFPLGVTLRGPSAGFDLTLLDPDGAATGLGVPQFFGPSRQEDLSVQSPRAGRYTVRVTARAGGGEFAADLSGGFTADATPPALTLDDPGAQREVRLGGAAGMATGDFGSVVVRVRRGSDLVRRLAATPAAGRWALSVALPDGDYTVEAEQGDRAGNAARTAARALVVDTAAPKLTFTGLAFTSSEPATLVCRVDGGAWAACASPLQPSLPDGRHTLHVRATDAAGNVGDGSVDFVIDTTGPVVTIDDALRVTASEGTPECRLDGGAWGPCGAYGALAPGTHVLEARATDAAGNASAVARREWTVAAPPVVVVPVAVPPVVTQPAPTLSLTVPKQRLAAVLKRGLTVRATCSTGCRVSVVVTQGKKVLARGTGATLKLTASARRSLAKAKRVTLTVTVAAPGATPVTRSVKLSR